MNELIALITITSTIIFAITSIYGKIIIEDIENSYNFFLIQIVLMIPILIIINYLISPDLSNLNSYNDLIKVFLASFFGFFGYIALYKGFEVGNVSVGGVMLSSRVLISIPLAVLLIGEHYPLHIYLFILISFFGAILVSYKKDLSLKTFFQFRSSGINYFLVTLICWAISNTLTRDLNNHFHPLLFLLIRIVFFAIIALITYPLFKSSLAKDKPLKLSKRTFYQVVTYIIIIITAQTLYIYALGQSLTIAEGLGVVEGVFTFILAISLSKLPYFKEYLQEPLQKITIIVRTIGVIITTVGTFGVIIILQNI